MFKIKKEMKRLALAILKTPKKDSVGCKVVFNRSQWYKGILIPKYALGFKYENGIDLLKFRKLLLFSVASLVGEFWNLELSSYSFDTLVIRRVVYNKRKDQEDIMIQVLFLKNGSEIRPTTKINEVSI